MSDIRGLASSVVSGALAGIHLTAEEKKFLSREAHPGVTLFSRNLDAESREGINYCVLSELIQQLQSLRTEAAPLLISIDQEGGRVARLKGPILDPGPAQLLSQGRTDAAAQQEIFASASAMGYGLRAIGINCNFAPCLDILTNESNTAIGNRVFATSAESVSLRGAAFLQGLQQGGVVGCLKHFPGQGDAPVDTHKGSAIIPVSAKQLWERELAPFRYCLPHASMVMVAHCIYPALDTCEATRSLVLIEEWLRKKMGYTGVVVSDDMRMGAVAGDMEAWRGYLVESLLAGIDLLLICEGLEHWQTAIETLEKEAIRSLAFRRRLTEAASRVLTLRLSLE
jgi:beta-N-acetylhexosaminidase